MKNIRPRRRGRPPKNQNNTNNKYLSTKNVTKIEDEDEESNQSSSTATTTSSSKYQTRSGRKSKRSNIIVEPKKRGRKRKKPEVESDDEYYDPYEDNYEETVPQSDEDDDVGEDAEESEKSDFDELEETEEEDEEQLEECDTKRPKRPVREKAPVFLDDDEVPELNLPQSSDDLLINNRELIRSLSIYEILRHFSNTLRLTPFRFEDFCVSLLIDEQTYLLSEIHIQLLKALIREDDLIGTQHGPQDIRDSVNIHLYLCDHVTWPEVLRIYLSSDAKKNSKLLNTCLDDAYPFNCLEKKLTLLEHLCDEFLNTQSARDMINMEGKIEHDEHCRACQKNGEMLMCDTCPAVFHLNCLDPPLKQVPEQEWSCPICKQNQVTGVTDCVNEYERQMPRQEPIGWDRHGRQYWFLSRRIIVEDIKSDKVWYYSTRLQFDELLESLDSEFYEIDLCKTLSELESDIVRQMSITEKLTKTAKGTRKSYLEVANEELFFKRSSKLKSETSENDLNTINDKYAELEAKLSVDDDLTSTGGGVQTRLKTGTLQQKPITLDPFKNRISPYNSINTSREEDTVIIISNDNQSLTRTPRRALPPNFNVTTLFKLGLEGNYRNYQNIYSLNPHALSRNQILDDRDKKRHLSHKFSLTPMADLKWASYTNINTALPVTTSHGTRSMLINILRQALLYLETNIAAPFMHPNWKRHREKWHHAVSRCSEPKEFELALYILESSIKPVLFVHAWNDSLGFTVLQRTTQLERDELKKKDKKGRDVTDIIPIDVEQTNSKYASIGPGVKLTNGKLRHQIWKQKGEEYRLSGIGGWYWLNNFRYKFDPSKSEFVEDLYDNNNNNNNNNNGDDNDVVKDDNDEDKKQPQIDKENDNNNILDEQEDDKIKSVNNNDDGNNNEKLENEVPTKQVNKNDINSNEDNDDDGENLDSETKINIEEALKNKKSKLRRKYFSKIFNESKLDKLLSLRMEMIEFEKRNKKSPDNMNNTNMDIDNDVNKNSGQKQPSIPLENRCYSPSCDPTNKSSSSLPYKCYSPLCQYQLQQKLDLKKKKILINLSEFIELQKITKIDGVEQYAKKVAEFLPKGQLPPSGRFFNGKYKTILVPLTYELKQLGRLGGLCEVSGFNYNAKINNTIWPYGLTPRPFFRTTWLYRTHNIPTLHCAALQLRVLWAAIRWDDMATKPLPSGCRTSLSENEVQTIEAVTRRDLPPFGLRSEYEMQDIVVTLDLPGKTKEISTPNRSGLRERRRPESPQNKDPRMSHDWVREEELELWEIKLFAEKQIKLAKERAIKEQKRLELKKRIEAMNQRNQELSRINGSTVNTTTKPTIGKIIPVTPNRANKISINTNSLAASSAVGTGISVPLTSLNGQAIKFTTVPTGKHGTQQFIIRTGTQLVSNSSSTPTVSFINPASLSSNANQPQKTTYIVRAPMVSTPGASHRPIIISSSSAFGNGPVMRSVNSISSNIRQPIPVISTSCPKKISTGTTVNAILTSTSLKTVNTGTSTPITVQGTTASLNQPQPTTTTILPTPQQPTTATILPTTQQPTTVNLVTNSSATSTPLNTHTKNPVSVIPLKGNDGKTHLLAIGSLAGNQPVQFALNSNNQIRLITKSVETNSDTSTASNTPTNTKTIIMGTNQVLPSNSINALILGNNQKVLQLQPSTIQTLKPTSTIAVSTTPTQPITKSIIVRTSTPTVQDAKLQTEPIQFNNSTTSIATNSINKNINLTNNNIIIKKNENDDQSSIVDDDKASKETEKKKRVVTSEMTQEVLRKVLLNSNIAPEIAQKLVALQRHHQEQQTGKSGYPKPYYFKDSRDYLSREESPPISRNEYTNSRHYHHQQQQQRHHNNNNIITPSSLSQSSSSLRTSSRSSRYSRSRYSKDDDYIYDYYPQSERSTSRASARAAAASAAAGGSSASSSASSPYSVEDDINKTCKFILKQLIDKVEKEERRVRQKELWEEKRQKKAIQMKIKFRQNHIEVIRRNILRRKSLLNLQIKAMVEKDIDSRLIKAKRLEFDEKKEKEKNRQQTITSQLLNSQPKITITGRKPTNNINNSSSNKNNIKDNHHGNHNNNNNNSNFSSNKNNIKDHHHSNHNDNNEKMSRKLSNSNQTEKSPLEPKSKRRRLSSESKQQQISSSNNNSSKNKNEILTNNSTTTNHRLTTPTKFNNTANSNSIANENNNSNSKKKTTFCLCNRPDDDDSPMIQCEDCQGWYHFKCVNLDIEGKFGSYICPKCPQKENPTTTNNTSTTRKSSGNRGRPPSSKKSPSLSAKTTKRNSTKHNSRKEQNNVSNSIVVKHENENENALYCICLQPYDRDKFYICCDRCNEWLHGRCVGVTAKRADSIKEYHCPRCEGEDTINYKYILPFKDSERLAKIFRSIKSNRSAWPFLKPVDSRDVPDYYDIIKEPIDLSKIETIVANRQYNRVAEFIYDMHQMFDNCATYNGTSSPYFELAQNLEKSFNNQIVSLFK